MKDRELQERSGKRTRFGGRKMEEVKGGVGLKRCEEVE